MTRVNKNGHIKVHIFQEKLNKTWFPSLTFLKGKKEKIFDQFSKLKNGFENQDFDIFEVIIHDFGNSDDDML